LLSNIPWLRRGDDDGLRLKGITMKNGELKEWRGNRRE